MRFATIFLFLLPAAIFAASGSEVMDKMDAKERASYIAGAVDMAAQGLDDRQASCVYDWYYRSNGDAQRQISAALKQYGDKPAVGIIRVLIRRACEAPATSSK